MYAGDTSGEVELEEMDEETAAKHEAFVRARGRHYSNEAEAMKQAARLLAEDEEVSVDDDATKVGDEDSSMENEENSFVEEPESDQQFQVNGVAL